MKEPQGKKEYYAKSNPLILNKDHLAEVGKLAERYGEEIGRKEEGGVAGRLHDFGKYSDRFQGVLLGTHHGIDHAVGGAVYLYLRKNKARVRYTSVIESILGHHDGLRSMDELNERWQAENYAACLTQKEPALSTKEEYEEAIEAFRKDFPDSFQLPKRTFEGGIEEAMLDTRMLFSCLVDADYTISALDNDPEYLKKSVGQALDVEASLQKLSQHMDELRKTSTAKESLNRLREQVFTICGEMGERYEPGLFRLTAPTGVGKTMAMLHFALRHCQTHGLRRIIVVLPFLTLAEQTEEEYKELIPDLLVDHSQKELPEEARELAARWDAPLVITTSVRFFESLFSDRPTTCRKLHHIANSVVLFDEAQSLPAQLAPATLRAVHRLCERYHCTMLFSTATQPEFGALPPLQKGKEAVWEPTELLPDHADLYRQMHRVNAVWCLEKDTPLADIAEEMAQQSSVCAIVNLRRHARTLFQQLSKACGGEKESLFLLSTDLCPAHRLEVVETIKKRLKQGQPCRVVATQCIEAGVDLDFDAMYRALAPLEAIIQAAGRCNRNGRLPNGGQLTVFIPDEMGKLYPGGEYERAANVVKDLWSKTRRGLDLDDPALIAEYYALLFAGSKEDPALKQALTQKNYPAVREAYQLIRQQGIQVIVPWGKPENFQAIAKEALDHGLSGELLRKAAPITVSCFEREWVEQHATPLYYINRRYGQKTESGYYVLNTGHERYYDNVVGLQIQSETSGFSFLGY